MLISERFIAVIQTFAPAEQTFFVLWQIRFSFGVFLFCLAQLFSGQLLRLLTDAHIVRIRYICFKIVVVVKIIFKSHIYPPFWVMESLCKLHEPPNLSAALRLSACSAVIYLLRLLWCIKAERAELRLGRNILRLT